MQIVCHIGRDFVVFYGKLDHVLVVFGDDDLKPHFCGPGKYIFEDRSIRSGHVYKVSAVKESKNYCSVYQYATSIVPSNSAL
jgi:hypothetical protein